jgi:type IV secretion system protein VirD4
MRQSFLLFPEVLQSGGNQKEFWEPAARQAFIAVTLLVAESHDLSMTMDVIYGIFTRGDFHAWLTDRVTARRQPGQTPYSQVVANGISDFLTGNQDMVEGVRKTVSTRLIPWMTPTVVAATRTSDFDLRELRRTPTTIYVSISPGRIDAMRPLLRLLFGQIINLNTDLTPAQDPTLTVPVLIILDEFARLDKISILTQSSQFVRSYGIRLMYVVQNKAQVESLYGPFSSIDVFDNLGMEIMFGTGDLKLAKEWEERLGDDTILFDTKNRPRFLPWLHPQRQTQSQHPHRRPLMLDQEIIQMPADEQLLLRPGMKPMRSKRIVWYKDENFRDLVCLPPEIPKLKISASIDDGTVVMPVSRRAKP